MVTAPVFEGAGGGGAEGRGGRGVGWVRGQGSSLGNLFGATVRLVAPVLGLPLGEFEPDCIVCSTGARSSCRVSKPSKSNLKNVEPRCAQALGRRECVQRARPLYSPRKVHGLRWP